MWKVRIITSYNVFADPLKITPVQFFAADLKYASWQSTYNFLGNMYNQVIQSSFKPAAIFQFFYLIFHQF